MRLRRIKYTLYSLIIILISSMIINNCQAKPKRFEKEIPKISFVFLRHGTTDWAIEKTSDGFVDYGLNAQGRAESLAAARIIKAKFSNPVFYCSILARTMETCTIVGNFIQSNNIHLVVDLRGREFGDVKSIFSKLVRLSKEKKFEEMETILPASAESKEEFEFRCLNALFEVLNKHRERCQTIIIVSHDEVFRCFTQHLINKTFPMKKGGIKLFKYDYGHWFIQDIENSKSEAHFELTQCDNRPQEQEAVMRRLVINCLK